MTVRTFSGALLALASLTAPSTLSCSEAERLYDCSRICNGYKTCIDDGLDVAACTTTCESKGEEDPDFATQASDCEVCIDDESCADAATMCTPTCAVVVSEST